MRGVFLAILRMGLVSGYAVLVVLLVRWLLRRFPKRYSYLLWGAVLLRLVCPVGIESSFSLVPDALYVQADVAEEENTAGAGACRAAMMSIWRIGKDFAGGQAAGKILADGNGAGDGMVEGSGNPGIVSAGKGTDGSGEFESAAFGNDVDRIGNHPQTGQGGNVGGAGNPQNGRVGSAGEAGNPQNGQGGITGETGNPQAGQDGSAGGEGNPQAWQAGNAGGEGNPQAGQAGSTKVVGNLQNGQGDSTDKTWGFAEGRFPLPERLLQIFCGIWAVGVLVFWLVWAYTARRFKKRLLGAIRVEEGVYETSEVAASFVDGIFHPVIYLATGLSGAAKEYVLCHERVHIRRHDPLIKALALFLLSIYWFHPLIWLAFQKMCEDMEMSCDERVVEHMGAQIKKEYSNTLLQMAQGADETSLFAAFGGNEVKSRVKNILSYRKPKKWLAILLLVAVAAVGIGLGLNPGGADTPAAGKNIEEEPEADSADNPAAGKDEKGQSGTDGKDTPAGKDEEDRHGVDGADTAGEGNSPDGKNSLETGNFGSFFVPDKIKEKSGITPYEYPAEFAMGDNLKTAITQLALSYGNFDQSSVDREDWKEVFVSRLIQNSRASFDYLDLLSEKTGGRVDAEELYYIHYSLTGTELDFSSYEGGSVNRYDDASAFNYGLVSGWEYEDTGDGGVLAIDFEIGYDGSDALRAYRLTVNLAKNPYSCFDGYSIISMVSETEGSRMELEAYASVLTAYHTALKEEWGKQELSDAGFSILAAYCYGGDALGKIGYAFLDLDGDGTEELLIGAIGGDDFIRQQVFELYCLKDGVPTQVFAGWERNRYYLCGEDGGYRIVNEGSLSAAEMAWNCNVVREGKLVPFLNLVYDGQNESIVYDRSAFPGYVGDAFYFLHAKPPLPEEGYAPGEDAVLDGQGTVLKEDAESVIRIYGEYRIVPEYVPFSDFPATKSVAGEDRRTMKKVSGKNLENQLKFLLNQRETWEQDDALTAEEIKYTVTDLNGNGRLEVIAASCQGTGHYTYADVYEVSEEGDFLVHYAHTVPEGDSQADMIWGNAPVYYSREEGVYRYVFDDLVRDGAAYYYEGKKSLELKENKILETTLAYRITEYENGVPAVTYGGGDGLRVTNAQEYEGAADQAFAGWEKGMAYFLWFTAPEMEGQGEDGDRGSSWYGWLEKSYKSFSVVSVAFDSAAGTGGVQTDAAQTGAASGSFVESVSTGAVPGGLVESVSSGEWKIGGRALKDQLNLILSQRQMWDLTDTGSDYLVYAVTDLDRNGRLELLSAYYDEDRGNTYFYICEVSGTGNALVFCTRTLSGEDGFCPGITSACPPLYFDPATGECCLICSDTMGDAAGHVQERRWALSLKNSHLTEQALVSREVEYNGFTKTITYHAGELAGVAAAGRAEYEAAADMAFADRMEGKIFIDWFCVGEILSEKDWYQKLEESYLGFSFSLPKQKSASERKAGDLQAEEAFLGQWKQKTIGNGFEDEAEAVAWYGRFVENGLVVTDGDSLEDVCIGDFDKDGNKDCFFVMAQSVDLTDRPLNMTDSIFYGCMNGEDFYKERVSEELLIGLSIVAGDFNHDGFTEIILSGDTGSCGGGGSRVQRMTQYRGGEFLEFLLPEDFNALLNYESGIKVSVYETGERKKCRAVLGQDGRGVRFTITGSREYAPFLDEEMPGWRDGKEPFGGSGAGYAGFEVVRQDGKDYLLAREYLLPRAGYGQIGFACLLFDWDENGMVSVKDFYVEPF